MLRRQQQDQLGALIRKYEERWPALLYTSPALGHPASRAEAAAELVAAGCVEYIGQLPSGDRYYLVDGKYRTTTGAGNCDCQDRGAPRDTRLVLHCHHGGRSQQAAEQFVALGFTRVYNVVGGIDAWSQEIDPEVPRY